MPMPTVRTPPPPGTVNPSDLYTDLATRTIWLGVAPAVNPDEAVLISDMLDTIDMINALEAELRADYDAKIALKANLNSPAFTGDPFRVTDITGGAGQSNNRLATTQFVQEAIDLAIGGAAGTGSVYVAGMIMMYKGAITNIGVGALAGWHLCDGDAGTPDLRDKFIIGAGNKAIGAGPTKTEATTSQEPAHDHSAFTGNWALTASQLPAHVHSVGTLDGTFSGTTGLDGEHSHTIQTHSGSAVISGAVRAEGSTAIGNAVTSTHTGHTHSFSGSISMTGNTGNNTGTVGASHRHSISSDGAHTHTITRVELRETLPFYALAYIMKL